MTGTNIGSFSMVPLKIAEKIWELHPSEKRRYKVDRLERDQHDVIGKMEKELKSALQLFRVINGYVDEREAVAEFLRVFAVELGTRIGRLGNGE